MSEELVADIHTQEAIQEFLEALFSKMPDVLGIDEIITACRVTILNPYGAAVLPWNARVALRADVWPGTGYEVDALYRGGIAGIVDDTIAPPGGTVVNVIHFRDGDRYEISGVGGGGGIVLTPWTAIWQYDVSTGHFIPHATIQTAINACAAGDYVLIPPGTYDEAITLATSVYVVEQIPGSVIINCTVGATAVTCAAGGYINVKEIRVVRNAAENSYAVYHSVAGVVCRVIVERIYAENNNAAGFPYGIYFNSSGLIEVHCKELQTSATNHFTVGVYGSGASTGDCNVWLSKATLISQGSTMAVAMAGSGVLNIYGPDISVTTTGAGGACFALRTTAGTLNVHDVKALCTQTAPDVVWCAYINGGAANIYDSIFLSSNAAAAAHGVYVTAGTVNLYHTRSTGHNTSDLTQIAGTLNVHACRYETTTGTITHLAGDRAGKSRAETITATWTHNSPIHMADDNYMGLGPAAGRIVWDSTPAPNEIHIEDANVAINGKIIESTAIACYLRKVNAVQNIPSGAGTLITWDTATYDSDSMADLVNDRIYVTRAGYYTIVLNIAWWGSPGGVGRRIGNVYWYDVTTATSYQVAVMSIPAAGLATPTYNNVTAGPLLCDVGDFFWAQAYQDSGGGINLYQCGATTWVTSFGAWRDP